MSGEKEFPSITVTELTHRITGTLERNFSKLFVEGEIIDWRLYPSGHAYFTLKDSASQISCVMFKPSFDRSPAKNGLKDGAKVMLYGNVTVYAPRGNYQLKVLAAKLMGEGELMQKYLELKAKLEAEGLFAPERKRPLPFMPRRIGIVTSEAGAVIHDMCTVMTRRFPNLEIRLYPSLVQGDGAPRTIIDGIGYFNDPSRCGDWKADLLIVARGGGSFEDLFCFNDEALVRALAASAIPTISAVGHETDYTLCDFAADRRAGTPSIAAEIAVPELAELRRKLDLQRLVSPLRERVDGYARQLRLSRLAAPLRAKGEWFAQRLDHLGDKLVQTLDVQRMKVEHRFAEARSKLALLSPYGVLDRGYSLTTDASGAVIRDAATLKPGDAIVTRFASGSAASVVSGS